MLNIGIDKSNSGKIKNGWQMIQRNIDRTHSSHPDHLAVGEATLNAVYPDARNEFAFPELLQDGLEPHTVPEVWLMGHPDPNHYVDISDTVELKIEALRCHESQMRTPERIPKMIRSWSATQAEAGGLDQGRLAEGYRQVMTH